MSRHHSDADQHRRRNLSLGHPTSQPHPNKVSSPLLGHVASKSPPLGCASTTSSDIAILGAASSDTFPDPAFPIPASDSCLTSQVTGNSPLDSFSAISDYDRPSSALPRKSVLYHWVNLKHKSFSFVLPTLYAGSTYGPIGPGPRAPRLGGPRTWKMLPRITKMRQNWVRKRRETEYKKERKRN